MVVRHFFLLLVIALLCVQMLILMAMVRSFLTESGFGLWTWNPSSSDTSQLFGDPYSFSHILHGIIFYAVLSLLFRKMPVMQKLLIAAGIEVAWEIIENTPLIIDRYRTATAALGYTGDSILNSLGDTLFCLLGFWIAWKWKWQWTLAFAVLIEIIMALTIRDNLTLNVLMLLFPLEAVKEWQTGK